MYAPKNFNNLAIMKNDIHIQKIILMLVLLLSFLIALSESANDSLSKISLKIMMNS